MVNTVVFRIYMNQSVLFTILLITSLQTNKFILISVFQQIAQKLTEERKRSDDEKANLEQRLREVEVKLEQEEQSASELQEKLEKIKSSSINPAQDPLPLEQLEVSNWLLQKNSLLTQILCKLCLDCF